MSLIFNSKGHNAKMLKLRANIFFNENALFDITSSTEWWASKLFKCHFTDSVSCHFTGFHTGVQYYSPARTECIQLRVTDLRTDDPLRVRRGQKLLWLRPAWADICAGQTGAVNWPDPTFHRGLFADDHFYPTAEEECT